MSQGQACAKLILLGEHAVVHMQPALALPLPQLQAQVWIEPTESPGVLLEAPDLPACWDLPTPPLSSPEPLIESLIRALDEWQVPWPNCTLRISSQIPVARGLGSGTAVTTALWRAICTWLNRFPNLEQSLDFVQGIDQIYHGRPSGIDAQVIVRQQALRFHRKEGVSPLEIASPLSLLVADSGKVAATRTQVEKVAHKLSSEPIKAAAWIAEIGALVERSQQCLLKADYETLGVLLNRNQELLIKLGVSDPLLNDLCSKARQAGAWGAKLSGAGGGGVVVALHESSRREQIKQALLEAGAVAVHEITIPATREE
jgi:mevalonate kinase